MPPVFGKEKNIGNQCVRAIQFPFIFMKAGVYLQPIIIIDSRFRVNEKRSEKTLVGI
jgi:hypothetical protein